jgi:hypothetical protein
MPSAVTATVDRGYSHRRAVGHVGTRVMILGQGFEDGMSEVFFNGVAGEDLDVYPTYIKATVPAGATTGMITVTTGATTLTSNKPFVIH